MNVSSERSSEVRLGLVLYGGVSLAIYIYGVSQEFFRAVRGRDVFKLIKALTDSDIVVDIISGTSAGGINGIFLAYALCNEREFSNCAGLWRREGDIAKLLHSPTLSPEKTKSLLDSEEFYQSKLEAAFYSMRPCRQDTKEERSEFNELDLFITGTDLDGTAYTCFDTEGHAIDVKDHRTVFVLKHREGRKTPFDTGPDSANGATTNKALAKLARITSCFPAAFQSVHVDAGPLEDGKVDGKLRLWGDFEKESYFLDGGVLDNKPFTHTIKEIFYRMADRKVDRKLFYVEPDPEHFESTKQANEPNIIQTVTRSLVSIPGYESISDDLKLLTAHNDRVERFWRFVSCLKDRPHELPAKTEAFVQKMMNCWNGGPNDEPQDVADTKPCLYAQSRLITISERVVQGVLRKNGKKVLLEGEECKAAGQLYKTFDQWPESAELILCNFDVYFRLRRLFNVLYSCPDPTSGSGGEGKLRKKVLYSIGRQIKLLEIVQWAMERLVDEGPFQWRNRTAKQIWMEVYKAFQHLLNVAGEEGNILPQGYSQSWVETEPEAWLDQGDLTKFNNALRDRVQEIINLLKDNPDELTPPPHFESLLKQTDFCESRMLEYLFAQAAAKKQTEEPFNFLEYYVQFINLDAQIFPLEAFADLREKDRIETVRISPRDACKGFSNVEPKNKVSGDVLHHFGGFLKRSWRSNDILWGRLDGVCQLVETLLKPERLKETLGDPDFFQALKDRFKTDLNPAVLFPHSHEETHKTLSDGLDKLDKVVSSYGGGNQADENAEKEFNEFLELLIEASQLEILHEDLPKVIEDAISEQAEWNRYRTMKKKILPDEPPEYDPEKGSFFQPGEGDLDPLVVTVASEELARKAIQRINEDKCDVKAAALRPKDTPLGKFFSEKYKVGEESVFKDIPPNVLLDILSTLLLVLRNSLLGISKTYGEKVQKNILYKLANTFLWSFRVSVQFMKQQSLKRNMVIVLLIAAAILFLFGVVLGWTKAFFTVAIIMLALLLVSAVLKFTS